MSTEVQKVEITQQVQTAPANALIAQAIEKGADIEVLERLFNLQERWEKNQAKKAFDEAMANFQGDCPVIKKTKSVPTRSGKIAYSYAPIDVIVEQVRGLLKSNGLSYSIKTEMTENGVKSICIVKHIAGHSEISEMEVPLGNKTDVMSNSQVVAAASTFSKRYAFLNAFGIMTGDDDNEQALQTTPNVDVEGIKAKFDKCKTIPQVKKVRDSLTPDEMRNVEIVEFANTVIKRIKEDIPVVQQ